MKASLSGAVTDGVCYKVLKTFNPKEPSPFGSLHIPLNISITTSINEIQDTASGQGTCQLFHLKFIWAKCKQPSQEIQDILCFPKPPDQTST